MLIHGFTPTFSTRPRAGSLFSFQTEIGRKESTMNAHLRRLLIACLLLLPVFACAEQMPSATITLDRPTHFAAPDGNDAQLAPGSYSVEPGGGSQLRLMTSA